MKVLSISIARANNNIDKKQVHSHVSNSVRQVQPSFQAIEITINKSLRKLEPPLKKTPEEAKKIIEEMVEKLLKDPEKLKEHRFVPSDFVNEPWMPDLQ